MHEQKPLPTKLPKQFYRFFWDIDSSQLDPSQKPYYVINRLLDKGDIEEAKWVLRTFPQELTVKTIKSVKEFSSINAVFWGGYFNIPHQQIRSLYPVVLYPFKRESNKKWWLRPI